VGSKLIFSIPINSESLSKRNFRNSFCTFGQLNKHNKQEVPDEYNEENGIKSPSTVMKATIKSTTKSVKPMSDRSSYPILRINPKEYAMVVDDEPVNRMVHRMLLESHSNFEISEHKNGKEAVIFVQQLSMLNPSKLLILMDINMPIMDGINATKEIRKLNLDFPIVIIAVSAFSDEEDIKK